MRNLRVTFTARYTKDAAFALFGAAVGFLALGHDSPSALAFTAFFPVGWIMARGRLQAFMFAFSYYATAARGVPLGAAIFFGEGAGISAGIVMWVLSSLCLAAPWAALHYGGEKPHICAARYLCALVCVTVPPVGIIGWASPLYAAGILLPGSGWLGIAVFGLLFPFLLARLRAARKRTGATAVTSVFICAALFVCLAESEAKLPQGWMAVDTYFGKLDRNENLHRQSLLRAASVTEKVVSAPPDVRYILLPETITGAWFGASEELWEPVGRYLALKGQTVVVGAEIYDASLRYDNALIFLGDDGGFYYRQRVPVPVSMWVPFGGRGTAKSHLFDSGIIHLKNGRGLLCLLCYEQFIAWPVLYSMALARPDMIAASANLWWGGGSITKIRRQAVTAWALLFDLPVASASNN